MKFKIGQKVRVAKSGSVHHHLRAKSEATITAFHSVQGGIQRYRVSGVSNDDGSPITQIVGEDQMTPLAQEFKVGDTVKIIKGGYGTHPDDIGKITTVVAVGLTYGAEPAIRYNTKGLEVDSITYESHTYIGALSAFQKVELDFTKPLFTVEGTPVVLVTTTNPRDAKFPVLVYEGKASLPTKYDLAGRAKNGVARRFLTNDVPKDEPAVVTEKFVALLDPKRNFNGQQVAIKLYDSESEARRDVADRARRSSGGGAVGVAKVTLVSGRWPA